MCLYVIYPYNKTQQKEINIYGMPGDCQALTYSFTLNRS